MTEAVPERRISILDEHTANRIAAGEVIERPASIVKELVENSIDAGATRVLVELEDGGKQLIKVTDNGCGMTEEDSIISLQRHATSKISSADDLFAIRTLGFRGEALPSIASVSMMEMVTKTAGESSGVRLRIEAGTIVDLEHVGVPEGTSITVRNVFFNTPARLKFLKTTQTELSHIVDLVGKFALSHHNVSFRLLHNGREVFGSAATPDLLNAIAAVYGRDTAKELAPISFETPALQVSGYVSKPSLTRSNRSQQVFFVNGRLVRSKTMTHAADEAFRGLLTPARYPIVIAFVSIDPELVDVNVHPTKAEVKFSRDGDIHSALYRAIKEAIAGGQMMPAINETRTEAPSPGTAGKGVTWDRPRQEVLVRPEEVDMSAFRLAMQTRIEQGKTAGQEVDPFDWSQQPQAQAPVSPTPPEAVEAPMESAQPVSLKGLRVVGQARNMYILAESDDGVLVIDQHVAHERVIYDRLRLQKENEKVDMQRLLTPLTLSLGRREALLVNQKLSDLAKVGFEIEWFGGDSFVLRAVPAALSDKDYKQVLLDMIDELVDLTVARHLIAKQEQVLITASCKMAVKAGDPMSYEEMKVLLDDLMQTTNPFMCPHGRPIIVSLSNWDLDRKFRRV